MNKVLGGVFDVSKTCEIVGILCQICTKITISNERNYLKLMVKLRLGYLVKYFGVVYFSKFLTFEVHIRLNNSQQCHKSYYERVISHPKLATFLSPICISSTSQKVNKTFEVESDFKR